MSDAGGDLHFRCRACDHKLVVEASAAGFEIRCPECGAAQTVPAPDVSPAPTTDGGPTAAVPEFAAREPELSGGEEFKYEAFISYRHVEPDRQWAKWLHTQLETYRVPKRLVKERGLPPRLKKVFRDEDELPASADLSREIERALDQSRFLIVICSPRTPSSNWVNAEVQRFRDLGRHDQVLALLIEGEPSESFPQALREIRKPVMERQGGGWEQQIEEVEPLAADVRPLRREGRPRIKRMAKLRMLSCILGCPFDDLRQRERERSKRQLVRAGLVMVCVCLALAGVAAAFVKQRSEAERQRTLAEEARRLAKAPLEEISKARTEADRARSEAERQRRLAEEVQKAAKAPLELVARARYVAAMNQAQRAWEEGRVSRAVELLEAQRPQQGQQDLRSFDWHYLWGQCRNEQLTFGEHQLPVEVVTFSPDGQTVASMSTDRMVKLWDPATGNQRVTFFHDKNEYARSLVHALAFAPDGKTLATWVNHGYVKRWNAADGTDISHAGTHTSSVAALAPDHKTLAAMGTGRSVELWDLATGKQTATIPYHINYNVQALAFSGDGKLLGGGFEDGTMVLWDLGTNQELATFRHQETARRFLHALAFSPDGKTLASAASEFQKAGKVMLWDVATGQRRSVLEGQSLAFISLAFSPDGGTLATGSGDPIYTERKQDAAIDLWDPVTGQKRATLVGHTARVKSLAFSPDGRTLASASGDRTVKLWSMEANRGRVVLRAHRSVVVSLAFSPDGRTLASGSWDGTARLWEIGFRQGHAAPGERGKPLPAGGYVTSVAFSPDGQTLATGDWGQTVGLWEVATGKRLAVFSGHSRQVACLAYAPDGKTLASGDGYSDRTLKPKAGDVVLWDAASGRTLRTLQAHTDWVWSLAFSRTGSALITGSNDGAVKVWDVSTGRLKTQFVGHEEGVGAVALSPSGTYLATAGCRDQSVKLWDTRAWKELTTLTGHGGQVTSMAFAPDGKVLATGVSNDDRNQPGELKLWDVATGQERIRIAGHTSGIHAVAFAPDGRSLAAGYWDGTIRLWHAGGDSAATDHE